MITEPLKILIGEDAIIEPQSTTFDFVDEPPRRVGDLVRIRLHHTGWGVYPATPEQIKTVVLLADRSGRQWLVEYK